VWDVASGALLGARVMGSVVYSVHVGRDWVRESERECVCLREKESERERERDRERARASEREGERESEQDGERESAKGRERESAGHFSARGPWARLSTPSTSAATGSEKGEERKRGRGRECG